MGSSCLPAGRPASLRPGDELHVMSSEMGSGRTHVAHQLYHIRSVVLGVGGHAPPSRGTSWRRSDECRALRPVPGFHLDTPAGGSLGWNSLSGIALLVVAEDRMRLSE